MTILLAEIRSCGGISASIGLWKPSRAGPCTSPQREFDDPFEGATAVTLPAPKDPRFNEIAPDEKAFEELRRLTKISCWNRGASESEAMWKLYASERKGIAVKTTAKNWRNHFSHIDFHPNTQMKILYGARSDMWT